jgi:hypothetical protein
LLFCLNRQVRFGRCFAVVALHRAARCRIVFFSRLSRVMGVAFPGAERL